jgi:uncharacterized protein YndB with AHSA1/START domain
MVLQLANAPIVQAEMLVRKPAEDVYQAFINPDVTTKFWFTRSSGMLEVGKRICWEWEMYGTATTLEVKQLEPARRIVLEWGLDSQPSTLEWTFTAHGNAATFVNITNSGFTGDSDAVVNQALGSVGGFALVLAGLKAYLEFGIKLNLIADRFPDQVLNQRV